MSGIRVNEWLHNSGTGGIWQTSAGNVGIASSVPTTKLEVTGDANISGVTTATAFIPSAGQLSHRNIMINGAMQVAQRGTSVSATGGYKTVDRFELNYSGEDAGLDQSQHTLTSSDTGPYAEGFRKSYHITNGNQTSGAGAADFTRIKCSLEAQDIANSGWDYTNPNSFITLSYWIKSSIAYTTYINISTTDGTAQNYTATGIVLSANTWKKVSTTIPGNSNLQFDDNNGAGLFLSFIIFYGTNYTTSGHTLNTWAAAGDYSDQLPDMVSTWWTTNDSTYEITGVQLEVGSVATPFEHRSYGDELLRCQRYYQKITGNKIVLMGDYNNSTSNFWGQIDLRTTMRAAPTVTVTAHAGGGTITNYSNPDMLSFNTSTGAAHFDNGTTIEAASEL